MNKLTFPLLSLILFTLLNAACNNQATKNTSDETTVNPPGWGMGVALYSFNLFPFDVALSKADSAGVKLVEGFSFHAIKGEFKDSTMGQISLYGVNKMKEMLDSRGMKMKSMYVSESKDANEWKGYFEKAKILGMEFLVFIYQKRMKLK